MFDKTDQGKYLGEESRDIYYQLTMASSLSGSNNLTFSMSKANSISSPFFILDEGSTLAMSLCSSELKKRRMFGIVSSISSTRALKLPTFSEAGRFSLDLISRPFF